LSGGLVLVVISSVVAVLLSAPVGQPDPVPTPVPTPQGSAELTLQATPMLVLSPRLIIEALPSMAVVPTPTPQPAVIVEALPTQTPIITPTPVRMASLRIILDQPAHLQVDGQAVGDHQDLELQLKPGTHKLEATSLDGALRTQRSVRLSAEMPVTVRLILAPPPPGTVRVIPPERTFVEVRVDDVFVRGCPCPPLSLAEGKHTLQFVNQAAGYDRTVEVVVKSGQETQVDLRSP
jgi:hypothetical protein